MMYDELIKNLRICSKCDFGQNCNECTQESTDKFCCDELLHQAANAIEELSRFAHFVAQEVVVRDEEWEINCIAFPEISCRKLNKLGVVSKDGEFWHYEYEPEENEDG